MSEALLIIRQIIIGMALLGVLAAEITVVMTRLLSKTVGLAALHTSENSPGYALGITRASSSGSGPESAALVSWRLAQALDGRSARFGCEPSPTRLGSARAAWAAGRWRWSQRLGHTVMQALDRELLVARPDPFEEGPGPEPDAKMLAELVRAHAATGFQTRPAT